MDDERRDTPAGTLALLRRVGDFTHAANLRLDLCKMTLDIIVMKPGASYANIYS
jgi:hypothetical protein